MKIVRKQKGFTLIELMVTIAILSVGIIGIYRAFFISLDYLTHITNRIYANVFLDNKICEIQREFISKKTIPFTTRSWKNDRAVINHKVKDYSYKVNLTNVDNLEEIFKMNLSAVWDEKNRDISLSKEVYVSVY